MGVQREMTKVFPFVITILRTLVFVYFSFFNSLKYATFLVQFLFFFFGRGGERGGREHVPLLSFLTVYLLILYIKNCS